MYKFKAYLLTVFACLVFILPASAQTPGVKLASSGEFTDKDKNIHRWRIDGAHTLIWDGQPYIPVGGVFYSKYISIAQTEENRQADIAALETIKNAGITDLLLKSIGPATWTEPAAWQELMDYLDSAGFNYGIDLADGPKPSLSGYIIEPARYRMPDISKDTAFTFDMPDAVSALWMLCGASNGAVVASGGASVVDGKVKVAIKAQQDQNCVLLIYPKKEFSNSGQSGIEDIWGGFDEFRDRLFAFTSKIKFGKGFRFFVDPLTSKMDLEGERVWMLPDSSDFRLEFEAYLLKKYQNIGSLNAAWGLVGGNITTFQDAARMMPLWSGSRGVPELYDRAKGKRHKIDTPRSKVWDDICDFRDSSVQNYLNTAADLLKKRVADVPVIYKASKMHRILANSRSRTGFDGLGVECYGRGQNLVIETAGPIYSLAEESARSMWFVVTGTMDTQSRLKSGMGYPGREAMQADLDSLAEIGVKGVFINGLQALPEETWKNHSLVMAPEQLGWLKEFKDKFVDLKRAEFVPEVIYYPAEPVIGAETKRLGSGKWWLPSLRNGTGLQFGELYAGYVLPGQHGITLFSRIGDTSATFPLQQDQKPVLLYPKSADSIFTADKKKFTLKLNDTPVIIGGLDQRQVFPLEVVEAELAKLGPLVARAKAAGNRVPDSETAINRARTVLKNGLPAIAYDIAHTFVKQISVDLGTYAWVEGENTISHSFDRVVSTTQASNGGYLLLDTKLPPPMSRYTATYAVATTREGLHEVWIAATGVEAGKAAFSFTFDNEPWQTASSIITTPCIPGFQWVRIGSASLAKGLHSFHIRVDNPSTDGNYHLGIDAIVVSPSEFEPNGIIRPEG